MLCIPEDSLNCLITYAFDQHGHGHGHGQSVDDQVVQVHQAQADEQAAGSPQAQY